MARRCLRQRPRVSYYEPEEPNLDEYVFCEKCADYVYEYCAIHGALLVIPDDKVPANPGVPPYVPRAALTIPNVFLHLNRSIIPDAGIGVFASLTLPSGVRFGPYRGELTDKVESDYCWQIYDKDRKPLHCVDAGDDNKSNWMRYVNCARHWEEQNLLAYQYQGQLYYRTIKIIPPFTELMVFYGSEFANELDVDLSRYNSPSGYAQKYGAPVSKKRKSNGQTPNSQHKQETRGNSERVYTSINAPTAKQGIATDSNGKEKKHIKASPSVTSAKQAVISTIDRKDIIINCTTKKGNETLTTKYNEGRMISNVDSHENGKKNNEQSKNFDPKTICGTKTNNVDYFCNECNKSCVRKIDMEKHMRFHDADRSYVCKVCKFRYMTLGSLNAHERCHINLNDCGVYNNPMKLHTGGKPYTCEVCNKAFSHMSSIKRHMKTHTGEKPYNCEVCNKAFSQMDNMKTHMRIHTGEKPYNCEVCNKAFTQMGYMKIHMRIHTGEKPYNCEVCNKAFIQICDMKKHMRIHTGEKPYNCEVCNKSFSSISHMKTHMRTHTGEKPYNCEVCNIAFIQISNMKKHMRIHTGEKPYNCEVCNKSFSSISHMKTHMRTHTQEKPHFCEICDRRFSNNTSLKKHLVVHLQNP